MCKKCKEKRVCFADFHRQETAFKKNKTEKKDRTYVCGECGAKYRVTKTKIITEFGVRFFAVVGVFEVLSSLEMLNTSTLLGIKQNFFIDKVLEIALFGLLCLIFYPFLRRLNSLVHWIFARWIKWYADESEGRLEG